MEGELRLKKTDHIAISIGKKPFGCYRVISSYAFNNDLVTQVMFDGQDFIWIPSWREIGSIIDALFFVENRNRIERGKRELSFFEHLKKMNLENIGDIKPC
jgi:hypothetical protein